MTEFPEIKWAKRFICNWNAPNKNERYALITGNVMFPDDVEAERVSLREWAKALASEICCDYASPDTYCGGICPNCMVRKELLRFAGEGK